jgi:hypothetical protein
VWHPQQWAAIGRRVLNVHCSAGCAGPCQPPLTEPGWLKLRYEVGPAGRNASLHLIDGDTLAATCKNNGLPTPAHIHLRSFVPPRSPKFSLVRASGDTIVNEQGQAVLLKGINYGLTTSRTASHKWHTSPK